VSEFLPFLINKVQAQGIAIANTFRPDPAPAQHNSSLEPIALADEMWRAHGEWWVDVVSRASAAGVPVLFFVDGGDGSASNVRLAQLLSQAFPDQRQVRVALFDATATGLENDTGEVRRRRYKEEFTLGDDPHANARMHRLMADFLTPIIADIVSAPQPRHRSASRRPQPAHRDIPRPSPLHPPPFGSRQVEAGALLHEEIQ
jgi:hypothetical protein